MSVLRVFEAFSGIGTQRMALKNLNIDHEVVAISEIDKYAIQSYEAIHGETNNLGDISEIETDKIPDHDLFTYSFPCTDISIAGKQMGLERGSGTRSSLLWECYRIIKDKRPKYLMLENVKNLVGKRFKGDFDSWLKHLERLGYTNYWKVLNAADYGIPQNRDRVFVISVLGSHKPYRFPDKQALNITLKDILEEDVDEWFYITEQRDVDKVDNTLGQNFYAQDDVIVSDYKMLDEYSYVYIDPYVFSLSDKRKILVNQELTQAEIIETNGKRWHSLHVIHDMCQINNILKIKNKESYGRMGRQAIETVYTQRVDDGDTINPFNQKISSKSGVSPTITTRPEGFKTAILVMHNGELRKLTPRECWRLMGCSDEDYLKAESVNSRAQLYKQAGNAIVVNVLESIFKELLQ